MQPLTAQDAGPLARRLAALGPGDLLVHLEGAARSEAARGRLAWETLPVGELADMAVLLRTVTPSLPP